ncbi:unnamed protein product [marine sediment metagenome]|uniref:Uncharacterized protein n=1 Tax=marine sediment metagenome TaxID=412755 RepID=X1CVR9_9ZZZZ
MGIGQMYALGGGRKQRPGYVNRINEEKKGLLYRAGLDQDKKNQDRSFALQEQRFAQEKDMAHQRRKQARMAQNMGWANLGLGAVFGAG